MITATPDEAALDWVRQALSQELRHVSSPALTLRAQNLIAIAAHHRIAIEDLVQWIHLRTPTKRWTAAEWARCCAKYTETIDALRLKEAIIQRRRLPETATATAA